MLPALAGMVEQVYTLCKLDFQSSNFINFFVCEYNVTWLHVSTLPCRHQATRIS